LGCGDAAQSWPAICRYGATKRAMRAAVRVLGIDDPPGQRIGEDQAPLKTVFVGRLHLIYRGQYVALSGNPLAPASNVRKEVYGSSFTR
jgi:hypothetical protein